MSNRYIYNGKNPFNKIIVTDYYDGIVNGYLYNNENNSYYFHLIAWDDYQDSRLFALCPLSKGTFNEIESKLIKNDGQPKYPIWVLGKSDVYSTNDNIKYNIVQLMYTVDIKENVKLIFPNDTQILNAVKLIKEEDVDDIKNWI